MKRLLLSLIALPVLAAAAPATPTPPKHIPSSPSLGIKAGTCRPDEQGPSFLVKVLGLKDRKGRLKVEVYPDNNKDFLADDNVLIEEGKTFRRVDVPVPKTGIPVLCIRVPGPGRYSVMVLHDRDSNHKFGWRVDGIGFAGNPKLGWSKPSANKASAVAEDKPTPITVILNYHRFLSMRPLPKSKWAD